MSKAKKQLSRARMLLAHQQAKTASAELARKSAERLLAKEQAKPKGICVAIGEGVHAHMLVCNFYMDTRQVPLMPSHIRRQALFDHAEKCLRELNARFPPHQELMDIRVRGECL